MNVTSSGMYGRLIMYSLCTTITSNELLLSHVVCNLPETNLEAGHARAGPFGPAEQVPQSNNGGPRNISIQCHARGQHGLTNGFPWCIMKINPSRKHSLVLVTKQQHPLGLSCSSKEHKYSLKNTILQIFHSKSHSVPNYAATCLINPKS